MTVLCLVERDGDDLAEAGLRALTFARELAVSADEDLAAAVFWAVGMVPSGPVPSGPVPSGPVPSGPVPSEGESAGTVLPEMAAVLGRFGVAIARLVELDGLPGYAAPAWARALAGLAADCGATAVVAAGTDRGSEVLAHLGAITGLPVAAHCVSARRTAPDSWQLVRQRWAGSLLEDSELTAALALLTVAPEAVPPVPLAATADPARIRAYRATPDPADLRVSTTEMAQREAGAGLATARVVVGGGRGVGGPDGFGPLEELAGLLGGAVGVSRVVTSQGWRPHRQQVGQTGTRISPELYLACGISGAIQHLAGCLGAKHIVAVNTDPNAPIMAHADYAIIGDLSQVIPALVTALRERGPISPDG